MSTKNKINSLNDVITITKEGRDKYQDRLNWLLNEGRKNVLEELQNAREQGDLSENAEYDEAKNKQAEIESEIAKIQEILSTAKLISSKDVSNNIVSMGSIVTVENTKTKELTTFEVVSSIEVDPFAKPLKLSNKSELVSSLLNHKVGAVVDIKTDIAYTVKIKKIQKN